MKYSDSHLFALYWQSASELKEHTQITIDDSDLVKRITQILRLKEGEELQLFNSEQKLLREKEFEPIGLGPTILRAETAVFFLAALFRSVFN